MSTLFLTDADVRQVFAWPAAITALREAYSGDCSDARFPPRSMARGQGSWLRCLSGVLSGKSLTGSKQIAASMKTRKVSYLISLFNEDTVDLEALMDAHFITGARTAATSALAVDFLAVPGRLITAVIGSGFEARMHVRALHSLGRIGEIRIYSPTPSSREKFAAEMGAETGLPIHAVPSADAAVAGSDLVLCAARSRDESPIIRGDALGPNTVVVSVGSTLPEQREIDVETIGRARLIVADMVDEVAEDTGDLIAAKQAGVHFHSKLHSLADLISGAVMASPESGGIRVYKSVGAGLQDLAVATMCLERARAESVGTVLPVSVSPVAK
jgi:ornithine cyclodeaminase/alanine dehydrogenase